VGCKVDFGFTCMGTLGTASNCTSICGDVIKTVVEPCDNGNVTGCINCKIDLGYTCRLSSTGRSSICGRIV
jgi:hypothetical protein